MLGLRAAAPVGGELCSQEWPRGSAELYITQQLMTHGNFQRKTFLWCVFFPTPSPLREQTKFIASLAVLLVDSPAPTRGFAQALPSASPPAPHLLPLLLLFSLFIPSAHLTIPTQRHLSQPLLVLVRVSQPMRAKICRLVPTINTKICIFPSFFFPQKNKSYWF